MADTETPQISSVPHPFGADTPPCAYDYFGAHRESGAVTFRLLAPHADSVFLCGDFNDWRMGATPMSRIDERGVWEVRLPTARVRDGQAYKYYVRKGEGGSFRSDPYAFLSQRAPETASLICDVDGFSWHDDGWMRYRDAHFDRTHATKQPLHVYQLHPQTWKCRPDGAPLPLGELADALRIYAKQMGYTHVELTPIGPDPYDVPWGDGAGGCFAPPAGLGSPRDWMTFVDKLHEAGIGVLLSWTPAYFPKTPEGLSLLDGTPLYELPDAERAFPFAGSRGRFDLNRPQVREMLLSAALFWVKKYHVDGLCTDAMDSLLYLDYGKREGEWTPNELGDHRDLAAHTFFQTLNTHLAALAPSVITVARGACAGGCIAPVAEGGLGFTLEENTHWAPEALDFLSAAPAPHSASALLRSAHAPRAHAGSLLSLAVGALSCGSGSLFSRAKGKIGQKLANVRLFMAYMMTHPGKKLTFMGSELASREEWRPDETLPWHLLEEDMRAGHQWFLAELQQLYLATPALWEDDSPASLQILADGRDGILAYQRGTHREDSLVFLCFLSERPLEEGMQTLQKDTDYRLLLDTDDVRYGGSSHLPPILGRAGNPRGAAFSPAQGRALLLRPVAPTKADAEQTIT